VNSSVSAAELFPHIRIVMGMVVGLGITRLLMGVAGLVQHPDRAKISLIHLLWAFSVLVELILFWWWEFALYEVTDWSFGIFAFLIFYAITLFLMAALLFPDKLDDYAGYEDFFLKRRHWFFGVFALADTTVAEVMTPRIDIRSVDRSAERHERRDDRRSGDDAGHGEREGEASAAGEQPGSNAREHR